MAFRAHHIASGHPIPGVSAAEAQPWGIRSGEFGERGSTHLEKLLKIPMIAFQRHVGQQCCPSGSADATVLLQGMGRTGVAEGQSTSWDRVVLDELLLCYTSSSELPSLLWTSRRDSPIPSAACSGCHRPSTSATKCPLNYSDPQPSFSSLLPAPSNPQLTT